MSGELARHGDHVIGLIVGGVEVDERQTFVRNEDP
jgi:hypothetical protein